VLGLASGGGGGVGVLGGEVLARDVELCGPCSTYHGIYLFLYLIHRACSFQ